MTDSKQPKQAPPEDRDEDLQSEPRLEGKELQLAVVKVLRLCMGDPTKANNDLLIRSLHSLPNHIVFSNIRAQIVREFDVDQWFYLVSSLRENLKDVINEAIPVTTDNPKYMVYQTRKDVWKSWLSLVELDLTSLNGRHDANNANVNKPSNRVGQFAKLSLNLPSYHGERGKAHRWWSEVKSTLDLAQGTNLSDTDKRARVAYVRDCLKGYDQGDNLFMQLYKKHGAKEPWSFDDMMMEFIKQFDQHSADSLWKEFLNMCQKRGEYVNEYKVRLHELVADLANQKIFVAPQLVWVHFRNTVAMAAKLRLHKEITGINDAVDFISRAETSNLVMDSNGKIIDRSIDAASLNPNDRCPRCHRMPHHHRKVAWGPNCTHAKVTLQQQLDFERRLKDKRNNRQGNSGRNSKRKYGNNNSSNRKKTKTNYANLIRTIPNSALDSMVNSLSQISGNALASQTNAQKKKARAACRKMLQNISKANNDDYFNQTDNMHDKHSSVNNITHVERNICMSKIKFIDMHGDSIETAALFDSGAHPCSYMSAKLVQRLQLQNKMQLHKQTHRTAQQNNRFDSFGNVTVRMRLPNKREIDIVFKVANIATEAIVGTEALTQMGAVIDFTKGVIRCRSLANARLPMIKVQEWRNVSNITSSDFIPRNEELNIPRHVRKLFPSKKLHEIAQILDSIPEHLDLSVQEGRDLIDYVLNNEYKEITVPRSTPTPYVKPVRIPFKPSYEGKVISEPPRQRPADEWEKIESQVKEWLKVGKVEKSTSPFNIPHVVAPKTTPPYFRLAQDFRRLNKALELIKFPLARLIESQEALSRMKHKSTLDQDQAYTQIPVYKPDRPKLAFSTRKGKYQFCTVPYGLSISGDLYCERKHTVLTDDEADMLLYRWIWSYVDDDSIGTNTVINHVFILCLIFERFKKFGFTIRVPKCEFLVSELKYGGLIIGYNQIKPNPKKGDAIANYPIPKNLKQLRGFLGIGNWQLKNFSPEYTQMASRLSSAFRKPNDRRPFFDVWKERNLEKYFKRIRELVKISYVNTTFNDKADETILYFDWSKQAMVGVLTQDGKIVKVIGKSCNLSESRYSPLKGEYCAFQYVQIKLRIYLLSLPSYMIVTDHRPLLGLDAKLDISDMDPMYTVWREKTEQFRNRRKLVYVIGSKNLADHWTRLFPWTSNRISSLKTKGTILTDDEKANHIHYIRYDGCNLLCVGSTFARELSPHPGPSSNAGDSEERKNTLFNSFPSNTDIPHTYPHQLSELKNNNDFLNEKGLYLTDERDGADITHIMKCGYPRKTEGNRLQVFIHNTWRTYVPIRNRAALICYIHGDKHHGSNKMRALLSRYYFPRKNKVLKAFLQACECNPQKHNKHPRNESKLSKRDAHITSNKPWEVVQIDIYKYNGFYYLTLIDLNTKRARVRKVCKIASKKQPLYYSRQVANTYMIIESSLPRIPAHVRCDNEDALVNIPHNSVTPGPVLCPQAQSVIERFHGEVAKLCRIHRTTPDKIEDIYNSNLPLGEESERNGSQNLDPQDAKEVKSALTLTNGSSPTIDVVMTPSQIAQAQYGPALPSSTPYKGRELKVGDLVFTPASQRRSKDKAPWKKLSRVVRRAGKRSYYVNSGKGKDTLHHVDNLKSFSLGEELLKNNIINTEVVVEAFNNFQAAFDVGQTLQNFAQLPNQFDARTIWMGYPGLSQMDRATAMILLKDYTLAYLVVPDLPCMPWYTMLHRFLGAKWYGVDLNHPNVFWVNEDGHKTIRPSITWWIAQFAGDH